MNDALLCPSTSFCTFAACKQPYHPRSKVHRFCSAQCRAAAHYLPAKQAVLNRKNAEFAARNRDRTLDFDARYTVSH